MIAGRRRTYADLPDRLKNEIAQGDFLSAFDWPKEDCIVVWLADRANNSQREVVYSNRLGRLLPPGERPLPPQNEIDLPEQGLRVLITYEIDRSSDVLYEVFDIMSKSNREVIGTIRQAPFSPLIRPLKDLVAEAVGKGSFPKIYASWPKAERFNYWVALLYRLRRQISEDLGDPNEVFNERLVSSVRELERDFEEVFAEVLRRLAQMEGSDPPVMAEHFAERTRLNVQV